jgi:hypothetical protein
MGKPAKSFDSKDPKRRQVPGKNAGPEKKRRPSPHQDDVSAPATEPEITREKERIVTNQDQQEVITNQDAGKISGPADEAA